MNKFKNVSLTKIRLAFFFFFVKMGEKGGVHNGIQKNRKTEDRQENLYQHGEENQKNQHFTETEPGRNQTVKGYRRSEDPKTTMNIYIGAETAAEIVEWAKAERTSLSTTGRAAIKVGLRHKDELYEQIEKEWNNENDSRNLQH